LGINKMMSASTQPMTKERIQEGLAQLFSKAEHVTLIRLPKGLEIKAGSNVFKCDKIISSALAIKSDRRQKGENTPNPNEGVAAVSSSKKEDSAAEKEEVVDVNSYFKDKRYDNSS
jgi:hypothetical protein